MEEQPRAPKPQKKRTQRFYALLAFVVFIALIVSVAAFVNQKQQSAKGSRVAEVRITSKGFEPATLVVKSGTKITWTNDDKKPHQVVSNPYPKGGDLPNLRSEILNDDQTYTYTADKLGDFGYHDQLRPTINGTITIQK